MGERGDEEVPRPSHRLLTLEPDRIAARRPSLAKGTPFSASRAGSRTPGTACSAPGSPDPRTPF